MDETNEGSEPSADFPVVEEISAEQVNFGPGLAGRITATRVNMQQAGALAIAAGQDAEVSFGGALAIAAGRDMRMNSGGAMVFAVGRDLQMADSVTGVANIGGRLDMTDSVSGVAVSGAASLNQSMVGILLSSKTDLGEGSQVLLSTPQAAAFGALFGVAFALVSWLLRKK